MTSLWCSMCGALVWSMFGATPHRCPPMWLVWRPDESDTVEDARPFRGATAEAAALAYAEWSDRNGDHDIVSGNEAHVAVRLEDDADAPVEFFTLVGEQVPHYTAVAAKEKP